MTSSRRQATLTELILAVLAAAASGGAAQPRVELIRTPHGGIQPRAAVAEDGTVHLIYYTGDPAAGDIRYARSEDGGETFTEPLRVNSQAGSAVAMGNVRGARIALGQEERVHVVWVGSGEAKPRGQKDGAPLLYSRLNEAGDGFTPQRNLVRRSRAIDGGGDIAADGRGNVYVVWHGLPPDGPHKETNRRVWVAASDDGGATFKPERPVGPKGIGACGCCGLSAMADADNRLSVLYRMARKGLQRHMALLSPGLEGGEAQATELDHWELRRCPLSTATIQSATEGDALLAWQTKQQVFWARAGTENTGRTIKPIPASGHPDHRKHPVAVANNRDRVLLAWTEGVGWNGGGALAWQVYGRDGEPIAGASGRREGAVPKWGLITAFARPDGTFVIVH